MKSEQMLHVLAFILLAIGGLNWGLIGLFGFNLVETIFGVSPLLIKIIYILVGVSTVYIVAMHKKDCKICSKM